MFSVVDANLLRPLPVPKPGEICSVGSIFSLDSLNYSALFASYPDYLDIQKRARSFAGLAAFLHLTVGFRNGSAGPAQARMAALVSADFFDVLGVPPVLGRTFQADEERAVILA